MPDRYPGPVDLIPDPSDHEMNRIIGVGVLAMFTLIGVGLFITWVARNRATQDRVYCTNNLRQLAQFAAIHNEPPDGADPAAVPISVPPGTVLNPQLSPDERLAWTAPALLTFNQRVQDTEAVFRSIDMAATWDADANRPAATTRIMTLVCTANLPERAAAEFWPTQYVGTAGVGPDAATYGLGPPVPPNAGCWRYDGPTPFAAITDGLSSTLLFAETDHELGPWLAGGTDTVRGFDVVPGAPPAIGVGGQFGGNHPGGGNFALADGSVRWLSDATNADVFRGLVTIAGGDTDPIPGE